MNFLDAHKIVHDFACTIGKGCEDEDDFFICIDKLPFEFDKDMIVSAFQIFIYHMIFFRTRTEEEYEQYYVLYQANIGRFLPRSEVLKIRSYSKIIGNKSVIFKALNKEKIKMAGELYGQFMEKNLDSLHPYRIDDIFSTNLGDMQEYKKELTLEVKEKSDAEINEAYDNAIELYAKKAYELANIIWLDDYFYYFQDFKTLRKALPNKQYEKYYLPYKEYIMSNK